MKRPTVASLKKVNAENLTALGAERLAEILVSVAATRPELKRRLRMELAAEHGADHLAAEIDRRLGSLQTSRGKISWRQRPSFVRDLDALRVLIAERLAALDRAGAQERLWALLDLAGRVNARTRDRDGELATVFARAADDVGGLLQDLSPEDAASRLADALARNPMSWTSWLPYLLADAPSALAAGTLRQLSERGGATPGWMPLIRQLADAAGEVDAYRASFTPQALASPPVAAEVAQRLLAAGRVTEAGAVLEAAAPQVRRGISRLTGTAPETDYAWEGVWIDYLERSGDAAGAQAARWASFERTLSVERAQAFTSRLPDFDDVEAEHRAFAFAAAHRDADAGLAFLMAWPALPEAAQMITARANELDVAADQAELWAAKLRGRYPAAAHALLRNAAATAVRRRDLKTANRLTEEADTIAL
jgi:hypothetical protein